MLKKINLLILDDEELIIKCIEDRLKIENVNFDITGFTSSKEALSYISKNTVDIVILDYYIDEMNGKNIVNEIRKSNTKLPIWILSGHREDVPQDESFSKLNINGYIDKGANFKEIISQIKSITYSL
jgi:DNA-binding response OmpR family regulator